MYCLSILNIKICDEEMSSFSFAYFDIVSIGVNRYHQSLWRKHGTVQYTENHVSTLFMYVQERSLSLSLFLYRYIYIFMYMYSN